MIAICESDDVLIKVSYNGLWKLLIDHNMQKKDLIKNVININK